MSQCKDCKKAAKQAPTEHKETKVQEHSMYGYEPVEDTGWGY